jgi:hypothetical protein
MRKLLVMGISYPLGILHSPAEGRYDKRRAEARRFLTSKVDAQTEIPTTSSRYLGGVGLLWFFFRVGVGVFRLGVGGLEHRLSFGTEVFFVVVVFQFVASADGATEL